jgi:ABC-2 type transport system ATP-binding protein
VAFAIETQDLTRSFEQLTAVDRLNLAIPTGRVFGFLGPNGAGKTTTVRMLTALIPPSSGTARVLGHSLGHDNQLIRRSVGMLTETPGLYDKLSALQNLVFFGRLYDLSRTDAEKRAEHYLRLFDLWERRNDRVGQFSKGMRQKLAIVRALLHEPKLVFLDEPTVGLDPEVARTVRDSIKQLRAEGRTVFLTTHNLPEADELCDLIAIFRGKLLHIDTPANLRAQLANSATIVRVVGDPAAWRASVQALPFVRNLALSHEALEISLDDPERNNPALVAALVKVGAQLRYVEPRITTLEEVYLRLIGEA